MTPPYRIDHTSPVTLGRTVSEHLVPERSGVTVWWSGIKREGDWILPRVFRTFTFMGNAEIDLTYARLGAGTSEIEVRCILGNIDIRVPMDIRLQCDGDGFMGNFEVQRVGHVEPPPPDAPTLVIKGTAYLANVTVKIMGIPGPTWQEKLKSARDFFYG